MLGVEHHQAGQLSAAEQVYRQILQIDPNQADAIHLLGVIAHQVGQHELAIQFISRSLQIDGTSADVHNNLAGAFRALGRLPEATASFQQAVALDPEYSDACFNLANVLSDQNRWTEAVEAYQRVIKLRPDFIPPRVNLAHALKQLGQTEQAIALFRQVLELNPADLETRINLGNTLKEQGNVDEAIACYQRALSDQPRLLAALINLGTTYLERGRVDDAIHLLQQAIEVNPQSPEAHNNLGTALKEAGDAKGAVACFQTALGLRPDYVDAMINLGNAHSDSGGLREAIECYNTALTRSPNSAKAHNNLGVALAKESKFSDAIEHYHQAIRSEPNNADAHSNLGAALRAEGQLDEAIACCQRALQLQPTLAEAHNHLANALKDQGRLIEAIQGYQQAVECKPDYANAHSNLIYTRLFCHEFDNGSHVNAHRQWNTAHAAPLAKFHRPHQNDRSLNRRLKIGYVSPDFRNHVIGRSLLPLFRHHDHDQFEIVCYSDVGHHDELTNLFQNSADSWKNTSGLTDNQLAQQIRTDEIDILVDLTMHLAQNRLLVFARKPAPIQVTFAGYPGTTGLSAIDYRLTDPYLDPPGLNDDQYAEASIRLPHSFWCFDPLDRTTAVARLPAIKNGYVTFGCLNNFCKVNPTVLRLWARVLNAVENSRLMLMSGEGQHRQTATDILNSEGVSTDRIIFVKNQPRSQYLKAYDQIDIGLDTLPYNGHMTSLDSLWMGVPVVTLIGSTIVGRAGFCQLMNLGLPELIAQTPERYIQITSELASDQTRLSELRTTLRDRMKASPLMDEEGFARGIETAFRDIWQRWCR